MTSGSRLEGKTFFLDRCLGKTTVAQELRAAGLTVEIHADHFPANEREPEDDDSTWLRIVGSRGWIILSKDQNVHRNQIEIVGLLESGTATFILTTGVMTAQSTAAAFLKAMPSIGRFLEKFTPPYGASDSRSGSTSSGNP